MDPDAPTRALHAADGAAPRLRVLPHLRSAHVRDPRYGQLSCQECHAGGFTGFAPRAANGSAWTEEEARRGFEAIQRLILPGDPVESRFLLKPLHPDGGGSYTHNGVRRWASRDDPEWQMLAAWVRGERTGSDCSM
jgi:hypothetical protein